MIRLLAAIAVLACTGASWAAPITRWVSQTLEGASRVVSGGPGNATVILMRENMDPLRSLDGGQTWTPFTVRGVRPQDVSIAPTDGRTWYAVTTDGPEESGKRVVQRTRDAGATWEARSTVVNRAAAAPQVGPNPDSLVQAAYALPGCGFVCEGTLARMTVSADGGLTWSARGADAPFIARLASSPVDPRVAYATTLFPPYGDAQRTGTAASPDQRPLREFPFPHHSTWRGAIVSTRRRQDRLRPTTTATQLFAEDIYITRDGGRMVAHPAAARRARCRPRHRRPVYLAFGGRVLEPGCWHHLGDCRWHGDRAVSGGVEDRYAVTSSAGARGDPCECEPVACLDHGRRSRWDRICGGTRTSPGPG